MRNLHCCKFIIFITTDELATLTRMHINCVSDMIHEIHHDPVIFGKQWVDYHVMRK